MSAQFIEAARAYVAWVDAVVSGETTVPSFRALHIALSRLQAAATELLSLSGLELQDAADSVEKHHFEDYERVRDAIAARLPISTYAFVFDPLDENNREAILTTLDDDLTDIYWDICDGLALQNAGYHDDAVWYWRFSYFDHWGRHLVHAQTAIWQHLALNRDDEPPVRIC